jgi:hypothetical protein
MESQEPPVGWRRWPFQYRRRVFWGRLCGAGRVLVGRNASIPKGLSNTETGIGRIWVDDYYGGCILSLPEADLYWHAWGFDGWGAGPGQAEFERADLPEAPAGASA